MNTQNAVIKGTSLGFEGHGLLTCFLHLDYGSGNASQSFGGYVMGGFDKKTGKQSAFGTECVKRILTVVGVENWEDLRGNPVRVRFTDKEAGFGKRIHSIGHYIEDKWFSFEELATELGL